MVSIASELPANFVLKTLLNFNFALLESGVKGCDDPDLRAAIERQRRTVRRAREKLNQAVGMNAHGAALEELSRASEVLRMLKKRRDRCKNDQDPTLGEGASSSATNASKSSPLPSSVHRSSAVISALGQARPLTPNDTRTTSSSSGGGFSLSKSLSLSPASALSASPAPVSLPIFLPAIP